MANELKYSGVLALEFFDLNGTMLVNEIAPRVHSSGHWTQQGAAANLRTTLERYVECLFAAPSLFVKLQWINVFGGDSLP